MVMLFGSLGEGLMDVVKDSEFIHEARDFLPTEWFKITPGTLHVHLREYMPGFMTQVMPLVDDDTAVELLQSWSSAAVFLSLLLALGVAIAVGMILHDQISAIMENMTFLETKIHDQAVVDRMNDGKQQ